VFEADLWQNNESAAAKQFLEHLLEVVVGTVGFWPVLISFNAAGQVASLWRST
jgi:hypothetical protein